MESILTAYLVTENNISELKNAYGNDLIRTATSTSIQIGTWLVVQTINDYDLFDARFGTRATHAWTTSAIEFLEKFVTVPSLNNTEDFRMIAKK